MLLDSPEVPAGTFPDQGLVLASQAYLGLRYADPGRKWGLQDAAAWHTNEGSYLSITNSFTG